MTFVLGRHAAFVLSTNRFRLMKPGLLLCAVFLCPAVLRGDLRSWWPLEDNAADAAGGNPGTWNGSAVYSSAVAAPGSQRAANFSNAVSPKRFVRAGAGIDFTGSEPFSAMAWIRGGPQDATILGDMLQGGTYRGWELHAGTTANGGSATGLTIWLLNAYPSNAIQVSSPVNVLNNAWHHVAFTYDGSRSAAGVKVYIDGAVAAASATLNSLTATIANGAGAELNLGSRQNGANHTFTGLVDEAAVFSHALSAAEVAQIHAGGLAPLLAPPALAATDPLSGETVAVLSNAEVTFSREVVGVAAADLLINGQAATGVVALSGSRYRFAFASPAVGNVTFAWAEGHGIADRSGRPFAGTGWSAVLDPTLPPPPVYISEFLASNAGGLEDEDYSTPDWIELTNPGPGRADLDGWSLSDDPAGRTRWTFPATTIRAGERLVVFASGKNRAQTGAPLHTDFRISSDGGHLALLRPDGTAAHVMAGYPAQEANVSFGPQPGTALADGTAAWRYFLEPTPGSVNPTADLPATAIRSLHHAPAWPGDADDLVVQATIVPVTGPVTEATLFYRVQDGAEVAVPMTAGPEGQVAVIPAAAAAPGQMIRWRVAVTAGGVASRWPLNRNAVTALPLYEGTTVRQTVSTRLPLYEVFVPGYQIPASASGPFHAADSDGGTRGAFAWNGVLHDNVLFRIKGTTSRYLRKRSHRVEFNPGHEFAWSGSEPGLRELNLNSEYVDPAYCRQYLSLWMQRDSGGVGAPHFPVRVHMNGGFWQLAFHTMAADRELLRNNGLDDRGALYKQVGQLTPGSPEKENRTWESNADYNAFADAIRETRPLAQRAAGLMDHADAAAVINYIAVARLTQEADDVWANMVLFRDSEDTLLWRPIPFDLNLSFGQLFHDGQTWNTVVHGNMDNNKSHPLYGSSVCRPQYPNNPSYNGWWNRLYDAVIQHPATRAMLLRRMRTLLDRFYGPPGTVYAERGLENKLDALWADIAPEAVLDRATWGWAPVNPTTGSFGVYGLGNIAPGQAINDVKNLYLAQRRDHFYTKHSIANASLATGLTNAMKAGIPDAQAATAAPVFGVIEFNPAGGNQDHEFIELRNEGPEAIDVSGWELSGGVRDTLDPGTVIPAAAALYLTPDIAAFRGRSVSPKAGEALLVQGNYDGHLSNAGETLVLRRPDGSVAATASYVGSLSPAQQWLAISELAYDPKPDGTAEFIELVNLSPSETLELEGIRFSAGIDFAFSGSAIRSLPPGGRVLIVRSLAAFAAAYGAGLPVAGVFANGSRLDNAGERIKLEDADSSTIFDFSYAPGFPWPGEGVLVAAPPANGDAANNPARWRLPVDPAGSPGRSDAVAFSGGDASDFLAYAMGGETEVRLVGREVAGSPDFLLEFSRALAADDAVGTPQGSADLGTWSHEGLIRESESRDPLRPDLSVVRYRIPAGLARQYVRVQWHRR
jgi:hypothetical protein